MILKYIHKVTGSILLVFLFLNNLQAQPAKGEVVDEIIAKVDDYIVSLSDLEFAYRDLLSRGQQVTEAAKCKIFENLIMNKLLLAKAEIDSVVVADEEVDQNLDRRFQMMISEIGSREKIEEYYGKSLEEFREELRDNIKEQMVVQKMQDEITAGIEITPTEVKRFFNRIPQDSLPFFSTEVAVSQIVKKPEVGKNQKEIARKKLLDIKKTIIEGDVITELFKNTSLEFKENQELVITNGSETVVGQWNLTNRNGILVMQFETSDPVVNKLSDEWTVGRMDENTIKLQNADIDDHSVFHLKKTDGSPVQFNPLNLSGSWKISFARNTGTPFAKMAAEFSDDVGSAAQGGNLGFQSRGNLVPEFEATALKLKPGEISDPVESQFGFHMIQLIERRGNEYNSRHILIKTNSSEVDIESAERYLDSLRTLILNDSITFEKAAKEYSDDKFTGASGGYFTDDTGAQRVSTDDLDPVIFFTIDTLKVGTISEPIRFKLEDGSDAVRILYYKSRIPPHQANLSDDYQKIRMAALNRKKTGKLNDWLTDARKEVFIDIDPKYNYCNILQ